MTSHAQIPPPEFRLTNWNVQWATSRSRRFQRIRELIAERDPDVAVFTEAEVAFAPDRQHVIESHPDYGYVTRSPNRRKVLLWSRNPWTEVDTTGVDKMPTGRFVAGVTSTPLGPVQVVGVCIPWSAAHVTTGRADRARWEDHVGFLPGLDEYFEQLRTDHPVVIAGDFNQQVPRGSSPKRVFDSLMTASRRHSIVTCGPLLPTGRPAIDHVAISRELAAAEVESWSKIGESGETLSDHDGVAVTLISHLPAQVANRSP